VASVQQWSGREAGVLRTALRLSVRAFADHLGVAPRTVAKWEALGAATQPRPDMQAILDTALAGAGPAAHARFELMLQLASGGLTTRPRTWEYETWADDLERAAVSLSRQDFLEAGSLLIRWLNRFEPGHLDGRGLYLRGRSLTLLADMRRDQGSLRGPSAAGPAYQMARRLFQEIDAPRRVAQAELSLAVVTEMTGRLEAAAHGYRRLMADERLSHRDKARAELWVGTALSKAGQHESAAQFMVSAIRTFETLDEPGDWSAAHQKLALARRGAGALDQALRDIGVARDTASAATPMQRVRLDTAHAHILLSDKATRDNGITMLDAAAELSRQFSLAHQLTSINGIRIRYLRSHP
jgi:hypothetical protein